MNAMPPYTPLSTQFDTENGHNHDHVESPNNCCSPELEDDNDEGQLSEPFDISMEPASMQATDHPIQDLMLPYWALVWTVAKISIRKHSIIIPFQH
jgi:hypothetical protein